ncbi:DUF3895 domain-containing protein [Bacillus cereus]|uniref:DUF3895 domain-containing protein n=1 Tax=Bacillus cereus TaxID=1396 RepID=A0A9W7PZW6_BACCE|nr:DUF3895 domain-containing protein [Bacillus cereus]KAA6449242.1 DUF3895 domain-containing protein [Bacillus cereus]
MNQLSLFDDESIQTPPEQPKQYSSNNEKVVGVPIHLIDNYRTDKRINGLTYIEMDQLNWYAENELEIRATDAVNELIEKCSTPKLYFSTEKSKVYPFVCMYFEYLCQKGLLIFVASKGTQERVYKNIKYC